MDTRLLNYYERELRYVREMGSEFATQYPKIAGRLGMDGLDCADPYVERLLEGFAWREETRRALPPYRQLATLDGLATRSPALGYPRSSHP